MTKSAKRNRVRRKPKGKGRAPEAEGPTSKPQRHTPRSPMLRSLGLATLSGVLYFTAFPGIDLWPLAFVALVPLFFALDATPRHSNGRVIVLGLLFGLSTNLGGYYWLVGMLEDFSGFPFLLCLFLAALLCTAQGGLLALFAWLWFRARGRGWWPMLVGPSAFAAAELVYPLLFQSYYANHFHDQPLFVQIVDLGGPMLLTAVAVAVNVAIYEVGSALLMRGKVPWRGPAIAVSAVIATLAYGAYRVSEVDSRTADAPSLTVGLVQTNMGIFAKREDPFEGQRRHIEQSRELEDEIQPDLLVWPESAYSYFLPDGIENVSRHVMGPVRTPLLFGGLARREVDGVERHYNTAFMVDSEGEIEGTYDKTFLLAFGEYLPFADSFPVLYDWSPRSGRFSQGDHVRPLPFRDYRISALICYEDIVPRFVRSVVAEGDPHLLVNITNDAWFGDTSEPWQHLALAKMRAVEHHRYLVRATNSGVSAIIDPVGRTVGHTGVFTQENLHGVVRMMTGWTPYQTLGDWPGWLGLAVILGLCFVRRREGPVEQAG